MLILKKLVALLGGSNNLKKVSIPNDGLGDIVKDLLKDRREAFIKDFKEKAIKLLDSKLAFDKETRVAEEQFKNTVISKKKEFSDKMKEVFSMVENMQEVEKSYYSSLELTKESEIKKD